jgi:hypothetical protein
MSPSPQLENFEEMLAAGKDGALLRFSLGNEHLKAGDAARAAEHLARAVAPGPRLHRGVEALRQGAHGGRPQRRRPRRVSAGIEVAGRRGDKQAEKEMRVFARRLEA